MSEAKELTKDCLNQCPVVPNLFLTVALLILKIFLGPNLKVLLKNLTQIFRPNQFRIRLKRFFRPKTDDLQKKKVFTKIQAAFRAKNRWSPEKKKGLHQNSKNFKHDFVKIRLLTKCSVAHRRAMAHRLKSTGLNYSALVYHYQTDTEQEKV